LLGAEVAAIQSNRPAALEAMVLKYGGTVVLKGAGTLVSAESGLPFICTGGNPGMAAPGMGDVLTGIIAALMAQGLSAVDSASVGVELHARAGDAAATEGERGMLASDLLAALRQVANP
jgi:NAD(P)H-hydrate repair Nnr-like enzyme with NAD(P)H-hydrate dehydratase domain